MLAYSSEIYEIETKDIAALPQKREKVTVSDRIVIKIGNNRDLTGVQTCALPICKPDTWTIEDTGRHRFIGHDIKGGEIVKDALNNKQKYVKVRIAFEPKNAKWDFVSPMIRVLRYKIRTYGSNTYHLAPQFIRKKKLERNIRTAENAYDFSNPLYHLDEQSRKKAYKKLYNSMQKRGFDDKYPLDIMLCRNMGVKDTLNQGHHRMSVALELRLKRVGVIFSSAGAAPKWLRSLFLLIAKMNMFFKKR